MLADAVLQEELLFCSPQRLPTQRQAASIPAVGRPVLSDSD